MSGPDDAAALLEHILASWSRFASLVETDLPVDTDVVRAQELRFLTRYLVAGCSLALEADPAYPQLVRFADATLGWGINNPDGSYAFAALDGDATYRITGDVGTAAHFDLQLHAPSFCEAPDYRVVATLKRHDLTVNDGPVEIVIGPEEHSGTWLRSTPDTQSLIIRQFFGDWEAERPAHLAIERVDAPYPPPPLDLGEVQRRVALLQRWLETAGSYWHQVCKYSVELGENQLRFQPAAESDWGGNVGQSYGFGSFRVGPGEAVVLEVDPPRSEYWMVQLANRFWESLDFDRRQSSLNHAQAELDDDGVLRAVICLTDPGVANWLDPAGNTWGTIMGRFVYPADTPNATLRRVALAELDSTLPTSTRRVTRSERDAILRRRHAAAQMRQCL